MNAFPTVESDVDIEVRLVMQERVDRRDWNVQDILATRTSHAPSHTVLHGMRWQHGRGGPGRNAGSSGGTFEIRCGGTEYSAAVAQAS